MPRFLVGDPSTGIQLGVCSRCRRKVYLSELRQDPNNSLYVCGRRECVDQFDPYRLPRRLPEQLVGPVSRPDQPLDTSPTGDIKWPVP